MRVGATTTAASAQARPPPSPSAAAHAYTTRRKCGGGPGPSAANGKAGLRLPTTSGTRRRQPGADGSTRDWSRPAR
eukprot:4457158-Pyramimonas_sp.AAC.1